MTERTATFVAPGPAWDSVLCRFAARGLNDVYFDHRYVSLYVNEAACVEAFHYAEGASELFVPYVRELIPGYENLWDFKTAYGYGGAVGTSGDSNFLGRAWTTFADVGRSNGIVAGLLRFHPLLRSERFAAPPVHVIFDRDTVKLDLDRPWDEVCAEYPRDSRRRLRMAKEAGVSVCEMDGEEALLIFGDFYRARMAELGARTDYFFDDTYFRAVHSLGRDRYKVFMAENLQGEIIGGALILLSDRFVHYHLSGSRRNFFNLAPNDVLRDYVIRKYLGSHWEAIHFGGGRSRDPADSLLAFKRKFSRQTAHFHVGACVFDLERYAELCSRWEDRVKPEVRETYKSFVLKYRYV